MYKRVWFVCSVFGKILLVIVKSGGQNCINTLSKSKRESQLMFAFFHTVNHLSGPLKKEKFTSVNEFKSHGL